MPLETHHDASRQWIALHLDGELSRAALDAVTRALHEAPPWTRAILSVSADARLAPDLPSGHAPEEPLPPVSEPVPGNTPGPTDGAPRLAVVAPSALGAALLPLLKAARPAVVTASEPTPAPLLAAFEHRTEALAWAGLLETATLGGGCFWCLEAVYARIEGVITLRSGYAGGHDPAPTYARVCRGITGHAEVVQITFDPTVLPYPELLRIFFTIHDPTTPDRQGNDRGPQYRSIVLYHDTIQATEAREVMVQVAREGWWGAPLVTEVVPFDRFHPAEAEHHRYYERNPSAAYCRFVVEPKVVKARRAFAHRIREGILPADAG